VLVHAGDFTENGREGEVKSFFTWFARQPFLYKICVAGNHDFFMEILLKKEIQELIPEEVIYLNETGVTIEGYNFWGSPITPVFYNMAFNRNPGTEIRKHWNNIPIHTDILITHGPPKGILDKIASGNSKGCPSLKNVIKKLPIKTHIFGHIHEGYGIQQLLNTTYINASVLNVENKLANPPIIINL
jgi:Icc-related predicted phosphoesterase